MTMIIIMMMTLFKLKKVFSNNNSNNNKLPQIIFNKKNPLFISVNPKLNPKTINGEKHPLLESPKKTLIKTTFFQQPLLYPILSNNQILKMKTLLNKKEELLESPILILLQITQKITLKKQLINNLLNLPNNPLSPPIKESLKTLPILLLLISLLLNQN
jgi:hypothetical protein